MCREYDQFKDEPYLGPITRRGVVWLAVMGGYLVAGGLLLYACLR